MLKNSFSSRWKSCEFLRLSCCWFPANARMWEGNVSKGEKVTGNIKSGMGPNEFLFMHGFVFWARVGGGTCVTQLVLRVVTCVQLKSPFCLCNFSSTLSRLLGVRIVSLFRVSFGRCCSVLVQLWTNDVCLNTASRLRIQTQKVQRKIDSVKTKIR
jgi:hypothetical protein